MPDIKWRIFLVSLVTVAVAKLLGAPYDVVTLFFMAFVGWTLLLVAALLLDRLRERLWRKPHKGQDQDPPGA
ncbi:MAG: hypothetical protein HY614_03480 [Candidatus Rokubacteria bacterium]|nr:hypothetical protein [Candidatus Rokubacteria bacterium]